MKKTLRGMTLAAMLLTASTTAFADQDENDYAGDGFVTPAAFVGDVPNSSEDAYFASNKHDAARAMRSTAKRSAPVQQAAPSARTAQLRRLNVAPVQQCGCAMGGACTMAGCDSIGSSLMGGNAAPSCGCDSGGCTGGCASMGGGFAAPSCGCDSGGGCTGGCGLNLGGLNLGGGGGCDSIGCGTMFGGGCDSAGCDSGSCGLGSGGGKGKGLASALGLCGKSGWARHEALLWFVQDRRSPSLVTTSATSTLPRLPAATSVFGGDLNGGLSAGYRGDFGFFLSDNIGVGGRFWILGDNDDSLSLTGNGTGQSIGRPFFNTAANVEDALLVNLDNNFSGSVEASSNLQMWAAEAYARINLGSTSNCQLDLIGGYSHMSIEDELRISSTSVQALTARTRTYNDMFDTENEFNGGQIGFEAVVANGRWFARSLTKVHLGDMSQMVNIRGTSTDVTPPLAGTSANSGLLALGNQGTWERNEFTFIPEMNFKLGYRFRDHVEMSAGYTFMMFDSVALAGDHVDRNIDPTPLNTNGPFGTRPSFDWNDKSMWLQGLDLGIAITF